MVAVELAYPEGCEGLKLYQIFLVHHLSRCGIFAMQVLPLCKCLHLDP